MKNLIFKKKVFNLFLIIYFLIGLILSINVGITHDESHGLFVWELNKYKLSNYFLRTNYDVSELDTYHSYYGVGFYLFADTFGKLINLIPENLGLLDKSNELLSKHPSVFIFFILSALYFKKIIYLITRDKIFSNLATVFYLVYPYLLGHSFFNFKDIPFMSIWLVCTYQFIRILQIYHKKKEINNIRLLLLSFLTAYLFSIRVSGILVFLEYIIFSTFFLRVFNYNFIGLVKEIYVKKLFFLLTFLFFLYLLHPSFWSNPYKFIYAIEFMSQHIQSVCTVTLGECMKAQNLPSSYIPIWLFFKLPIIIIFGFILFPFYEKKIFLLKNNIFLIGSLLLTILSITFLLIILNVNLYDELRQIIFIFPLILICSLSIIYFFSKKIFYILFFIFSIYFLIQNIKIFPYNYLWLNNLTHFTKINGVFELDYWGVSTKRVSDYLVKQNINDKICILSNRSDAIKAFNHNKSLCLKSLSELHKKNKRPFYVFLGERALKKGVPNNCKISFSEHINLNFSKEKLILANVFFCD